MKIFTKEWWAAAGVRAIKTFAEGALAVIGTQAMFVHEVNWLMVLSAGALAAVVSFLFALKGLPEVNGTETADTAEGKHYKDENETEE